MIKMAIHPVFVHFHTGILAATAALGLIMILLRMLYRDSISTPDTRLAKIFHEADIFIFWGNFIGLLGLFAGMITGFMDWPMQALIDDPLMRFKILWSIVGTMIYIFLVLIRAKMGDKIWTYTSTYLIYGILTVVGGGLMIILAAMGGIAVYGTSILSPILDWIGLPWP